MRRQAVAVLLASLSACDLYFEASGERPPDCGPDTGPEPVEVVRVVDEAPGPNCEFGGQATLRGLDVNSNGVLDDDEVTSIAYACNSPTVLTRTEAEPPGANCFAGGEATHSGSDTNSNGLLDDAEVQSTRYRCNSTFIHGDVVIHEPEDLDQLAYITLITGSLTINSTTVTSISLPHLTHIGQFLRCGSYGLMPCALTSLSMPSLAFVRFLTLERAAALTSIEFPVLAESKEISFGSISVSSVSFPSLTHGAIHFFYTAQLDAVSVPNLVDGGVSLTATPALTELHLPSLVTGHVGAENCTALTSISVPQFEVGEFYVDRMPALTSVSLPAFETATKLNVTRAALQGFALPALTSAGGVVIGQNSSLSVLAAPLLEAVHQHLFIAQNPNLPNCRALELWKQAGFPSSAIYDNDDSATCE